MTPDVSHIPVSAEEIFRECREFTEKDNLEVYHAWIRERDSPLFRNDSMTLLKGLKEHSILDMDGNLTLDSDSRSRTGIWGVSTRHVSRMKIRSGAGDSRETFRKMVRGLGYIFREFGDFSRLDFVPHDRDALVMIFQSDNPTNVIIGMEIDHLNAWPDSHAAGDYRSTVKARAATVVSSNGRTSIRIEGGSPVIRIDGREVTLEFMLDGQVTVIISREDLEFSESMLHETLAYHSSMNRFCRLVTPLFQFNKAFIWAKHDLLELFTDTGDVSGWYAGLPQFSWFFGRDGEWMSMAATESGFEKMSESHLSLLWKYSLNGRIPHEIPADTNIPESLQIASNGLSSRYMSIDSSPLWIISCIKLWKWHGVDFRHGEVDHVVDFLRGCDNNGDGLLENDFSKGLIGWPESWAEVRDGVCVDVNALWIEALIQLERFRGSHVHANDILMQNYIMTFFHQAGETLTLYDSVEGETVRTVRTPMQLVPAMFFSSSLMRRVVKEMSGDDMQTPWGTRSMSSSDPMYDGSYHLGTVWPLMTGWYVLAAYRNSLPEEAFRALSTFPGLVFGSPDPGRINETYDDRVEKGTGQFAQGWSSSLFIQSVIEGLFGLDPDGKDGVNGLKENFNPMLPGGWDRMSIENLKYRGKTYSVTVSQNGCAVEEDSLALN